MPALRPEPRAGVLRIKPYVETAPAIAAGIAAIEDTAHLDQALAHNERWSPWLVTWFASGPHGRACQKHETEDC